VGIGKRSYDTLLHKKNFEYIYYEIQLCFLRNMFASNIILLLHCALASGAVYCNRSCLCVCGGRGCLQRADGVCGGRAVSVTTITQNCVHRSSPNCVC